MKKKWLAIGIILLFIGVAVAPSINQSIVKASTDDDLVEVTTQACGIQGYGNTTVKLTREQYQNLEQYLVEFRARLNQTSTREEAAPIFKEAVVELDKYGLLPKGTSVEQAQKLVIRKNLPQRIEKNLKYFLDKNDSNFFCLIAGKTTNSLFWSFRTAFSYRYVYKYDEETTLLSKLDEWAYKNGYNLLSYFIGILDYLIFFGSFLYFLLCGELSHLNPICLGGKIGFGSIRPSSGWIFTCGLNLIKRWNGTILGDIQDLGMSFPFGLGYHTGTWGFIGFHIYNVDNDTNYFLGSALLVKISLEPPI